MLKQSMKKNQGDELLSKGVDSQPIETGRAHRNLHHGTSLLEPLNYVYRSLPAENRGI